MPSPLGHAFGGIAVAWLADLVPRSRAHRPAWDRASFFARAGGPFTLVCAGLAAAPDLDLSFVMHRTATHSVTAVALVTIVAALVTGQVTRRQAVLRIALICGAAYASHLLLDWLGIDNNPPRGIQLLWPFSDEWFISGLDLFIQTERRRFFTWSSVRTNLLAMAWETLILVPVLAAIWLVRVKALAGLPAELPRGDHTA
jgi:membrane-bound metal-dependent hydrolase YbcI (DUF457 family)